jgi:hypothetical protein
MPTEDHSSDRSHQGLPQGGVELSLDELAKGLASGNLSRGKALKLMGAALVGGALASVGIGEASADPGGCKRNGKSCKNDEQCCSENCDSVSGTCTAACGAIGATCDSGTQCCSGFCQGGMCVASCIPPNAIPCNPDDIEACGGLFGGCSCIPEASGGAYCSNGGGTGIPCTTACDCPAGQVCTPFATGGLCNVPAEVCPTG